MKTGISTACFFGNLLNEDALKQIGRMKIANAEIFFSARMEYKPGYVKELSRICDGEGISIRSIHSLPTQFEPQLFSSHPRQMEEAMDVFMEVLEAGNALGAGIYVFHGPIWLKTARKMRINFGYAGERVSLLADQAKEYGLKLAYETVHWCWYQYPGFAKELLSHANTENLFFTLDLKQVAQSGFGALEYIDGMQGRLAHVHLCDFIKTNGGEVIPKLPFLGEVDWPALRAKLAEIGYSGMLMLEVYTNNYENYEALLDNFNEVTAFFEE